MKYIKHFKTISKHKWHVMIACFKSGNIWRGILHDLSKFSHKEFHTSVKHFQGTYSPIKKEKSIKGYSLVWQNHKAKNKHHWQYWTDFERNTLIAIKMPPKYLSEMICDWVGAGKAYDKGWTIQTFISWYEAHESKIFVHEYTKRYINKLLSELNSESDIYKFANYKNIAKFYREIEEDDSPARPTVYEFV